MTKTLLSLSIVGLAIAATAQTVPVVGATSSSAQAGYLGPQNLIDPNGLVADPPGSDNYRLKADALNYTSGYGNPNDEAPLVHFDFGKPFIVNKFRVWNANGPGYTWRGFKDVTIQYSNDSRKWVTIPERFRFAQAPGLDSYFGELKTLPRPVRARYIRFCCNRTWRNFPQSDVASLGRVRFFSGGTVQPPLPENGPFPNDAGVIDVKEAPYFAKGDGVTDDTAAIQKAIRDWEGQDRQIFLPAGTYLVSAPIRFTANTSANRNYFYGRNHLRGAGKDATTIRLKDLTLTDPKAPQAVLSTGLISFWNGNYEETTADWFNNSVRDLTIDTGKGNPGAKGLEFFSNNVGSVRDVRITSGDGQGEVGLELGHADKNGPLLVKGLEVSGFKLGVHTGATVNSQTFEDITLRNQTAVGFQNDGQCVSIRTLNVSGAVPGFVNTYGFATVIDGTFTGSGGANKVAAISNGELLFARNIQATGYKWAVDNQSGTGRDVRTSFVGSYFSTGATQTLFPVRSTASINLPVSDAPFLMPDPAGTWANVRNYRLTTEADDSAAFQRAIDSGATTVYLPADAAIILRADVILRKNVRRVVGFYASIAAADGARIRALSRGTNVIFAEQFKYVPFENASANGLAVRDSEVSVSGTGVGDLFLENIAGEFKFGRQRVFGRQINSEPEGLKISNAGGKLWILGLKTERAGTLIQTTNGGTTEVLGGLCYTTTNGTDPMFTSVDSRLSLTLAEVAYGPTPYATLVRETRAGVQKELLRGQAPFRFSWMNGSAILLFRGG
jgi:Pectate lyase superfamily protein/F5/8 type C domain